MELRIKTIEEIKDIINRENEENAQIMVIPDKIDFPFPELYKEIVTKYSKLRISPFCDLYGLLKSIDITNKFYNENWNKEEKDKIKSYWFIGDGYSYDYWLIDKKGNIYYWKTEWKKQYELENIINIKMDFEQWLIFAYIEKETDKELEKISDSGYDEVIYEPLVKEVTEKYLELVKIFSNELYDIIIKLGHNLY